MSVDLFGRPVVDEKPKYSETIRREIGPYNYRLSETKDHRCKTCDHCYHRDMHGHRYYKCEFVGFSRCEATDIRANHVCDAWKEETDNE